jgi:thymidylate kinase
LGIIRALADALREESISSCLWKSNEHLAAALAGETDLDILFDETRAGDVKRVLAKLGYLEFMAVPSKRYPSIADYVGIDPASGRLVHVHAHFRLVVGESNVKSFRLPWENAVLGTRREDRSGFFLADPAQELLLLLVRLAIKIRFRPGLDTIRFVPKRATISKEEREYRWLKERTSANEVSAIAASLLGSQCETAVRRLCAHGLDERALLELYRLGPLERFRGTGKLQSFGARWVTATGHKVGARLRKRGLIDMPLRRTAVDHGLIVAVLGSDGSGKSSLVQNLSATLAQKVDVLPLYLGSGNGSSSWMRRPLIMVHKRFASGRAARRREAGVEARGGERRKRTNGFVREAWDVLWAISLALEKRQKLRRAQRARSRGMIVITDRYPQSAIKGYNDGPLLERFSNSTWRALRSASAWERRAYDVPADRQPDLVLKLLADPALLHSRRREMDLPTIIRKQNGVALARFPQGTAVIEIDASRSLDEVLIAAANEVARHLAPSQALRA